MTREQMVEKLIQDHGYTKPKAENAVNTYINAPEGSISHKVIGRKLNS